jgi:nucleic acid/nucleotide deaminase of polymorphic system toxin
VSRVVPEGEFHPYPFEVIHTTANHPWLMADRGWVHAGDLRPGEQVVTLPEQAGNTGKAQAATVVWVRVAPGVAAMDNLTVAQDHTYAVGDARAVAHNDNGEDCLPYPGERLPTRTQDDPTTGRFVEADGNYRTFQSGHSANDSLQPRRLLPDKVPGMERRVGSYDHAEAQAASYMRLNNVHEADFWINNASGPCIGVFGCGENLKHMLPEGATLTVHWPGAKGTWVEATYVGLPDAQWNNQWKFP